MPNLREALKQTSGVDIGGNEFTLQETDVQPYIDNPEIAQMEADVTKARYGGKAIQDVAPSMPAAGEPPMGAPRTQAIDFSRRGDFEKSVFKQNVSENIPDGNPFNFNPTASLNAISKRELPELFEREFRGQVTWQDRHLLDDDQKKYWMSTVKRYRAHVKNSLVSERETAINSYNQMMNQFDNAAKEQEGAMKRKRQISQDVAKAQEKTRERKGKREDKHQAYMKERSGLLTEKRKLTTMIFEAFQAGNLSDAEKISFNEELQGVNDRLALIDAELKSSQVPKPKSAVTKVKAQPGGTEGATAKDVDGKTVVRKKIPKQGQKTVVRTALHKGNKVLIYSDGSKAYADEVK